MDTIYKNCGYPAIEPRVERIPAWMKARKWWAVWIAEPRPNQPGKYNKAPRNPVTGVKIGANNADNFGTYDQAVAALKTGKYSGIGILVSDGVTGIDIDDYDNEFERAPEVKSWVTRARSRGVYCEQSPSGKGLRLLILGNLPAKGRKAGSLEIYNSARFLTITGKLTKGSSGELISGQDFIDEFLAFLPADVQRSVPEIFAHAKADSQKIEELCSLVSGTRPALWDGIWEGDDKRYPSQSEADLALVGEITRKAVAIGVTVESLADTVGQVFVRSGLFREDKALALHNHTVPKAIAEVLAHKAVAVQVAQEVADTDAGAELATSPQGDILAGRQYARAMRGKLIHVPMAGRWLRWDFARWGWCACGEEMAAAKKVADKILDYATTLFKADQEKHKKLLSFAFALQNIRRLEAMIELAKSEEGMAVGAMTDLDSNPWLLGVRNGVVNLKDGGLLAPDPKMLITRQCAAEYRDDAQCPHWLKFLDEVFEEDQETIAFVQRALGYTLTGTTTEEKIFICVGFGANGKSVFANIVGTILSDYSRAAPASLLTVRRADDTGPRNDLAMLCGARQVSINETQSGDRLDEAIVKTLAGRETVSARFLHKEFFDYTPTAKPWLRTNHRPVITGEDDGIWRRIALIPFRRKFAEHERDPWLESKLLEERDGILAWMVRGCLDWQRYGLRPSPTVRRESAAYRTESDLLGEFLEDQTQAGPNTRVEQSVLYFNYRTWHDNNGTAAGSKASLTRKLKERGFVETKSNGKRYYAGLEHRIKS